MKKKIYCNELNDKAGILRNVPLDYVFTFLKNLDMSSSVWVLYLAFKGMNLWQIGLLEGCYHVTSMICEIPSGAAADLLGRRNTVVCGRICIAVSCILMLALGNFWGFGLAFVIQALGNNLNSGSEEALVYDSMKQCGREHEYLKVNGRINLFIEIAQAAAVVMGGVLAEYSYVWCYGASILIAVLALVPAVLMKEPELEGGKCGSLKQHFATCAGILSGSREIRRILLYNSVVFAFYSILFFYSQQYFYDMGLNKVEISIVMLFNGGASCLGAVLSGKIYGRLGEITQYAAAVL